VRGTERLGWSQPGDVSKLKFRAYVDNRPVDLTGVTCSNSGGEAECHAPLPPMTDGTHTIEVVNVTASGVESARSAPFTVQKVAAKSSIAALPMASSRSGALRFAPSITIADGLSFTADIVTTGVRAPAQLAALPDGRLLISDADGRVRMVQPGEVENREPALDATMLTSLAVDPMGLASHPDFAQNRFVYLSLLEHPRAGESRLRLVRLREAGDRLGEPATLFDAPVAGGGDEASAGPRMAFGPDGLLYVMLPPGLEFVNEPAASTPLASMLRLTDEGRVPPGEPLSGIAASPLAFTWHPSTGALWVMFRGQDGQASVRSLGGRERAQVMGAQAPRLLAREGVGSEAGTLFVQSAPDDLLVAQALLGTRADGSKGLARLALPLQSTAGALSDRVGDVVTGVDGTLFAVTNNGLVDGGASAASDVVVRLTPSAR
jgi:glucose/arabinose dehydrogenase